MAKIPEAKSSFTEDVKAPFNAMPPEPEAGSGFHAYPHNGAPVFLFDNKGARYEATWRQTRRFAGTAWVYDQYWSFRNSGGAKIDFTPVGWLKHEESLLVAKRVGK